MINDLNSNKQIKLAFHHADITRHEIPPEAKEKDRKQKKNS